MNRLRKVLLSSLCLAVLSFSLTGCGGEKSGETKAPIDPKSVPGNMKVNPAAGIKENPPQ